MSGIINASYLKKVNFGEVSQSFIQETVNEEDKISLYKTNTISSVGSKFNEIKSSGEGQELFKRIDT